MFTNRPVSYRLVIKEIINGELNTDERPKIIINNTPVERVDITGVVVRKNEYENYGVLVIDDSTETIRVKFFKDTVNQIKDISEGDIVNVLGRIGYFNNELHIAADIVRKVDFHSEMLHKINYLKNKDKMHMSKKKDYRKEILNTIKSSNGVKLEELEKVFKDVNVKDIINELMVNGEIYEPEKGVYKVI